MKSKVAFLYQARKMPNTIIPALHLKRNIFECFLFFNFPFSIQFWRLNPSNLSSEFFAERYRPELTVGPVCLPVVGEELEPGARTLSWRPEEERRGGLLGRSSLGTHHSDEHPRQVWQRRAADHGTWFVSRVERIFPKCSTHLSICHMRFVALKGGEIVVWEQLSLGGYHGQTENSVCANWKAHFPQL